MKSEDLEGKLLKREENDLMFQRTLPPETASCSQPDSEIGSGIESYPECDNYGNLCGLIIECDGQVFSWKRLKIAAYYLSPKGSREGRNSEALFSRRFDNSCYAGPDDVQFKEDVDWLVAAGYLTMNTEEIVGASEHLLYKLTESGKELGLLAQGWWTDAQWAAVRQVAQDLKEPSKSVSLLIQRYAKQWDTDQLRNKPKI